MNKIDVESIIKNTCENYKGIDLSSELEKFKDCTGPLYQEFLEYLDTNCEIQLAKDFSYFLATAPDIIENILNNN